MKKIMMVTLFAAVVFNTAQAQTNMTSTTKAITEEQKNAAKVKKAENLIEAFTKAGLSNDEQLKARTELDESNEKIKSIKADSSLSDDDKRTKVIAINKERKENLKAIMGEAKYELFEATQKMQRQSSGGSAG